MYSRILVPLDGSPKSELALRHGCELARRYDAELLLVSSVAPPTDLGAAEHSDDGAADTAKAREYLDTVVPRLQAEGLRCQTVVMRADPARAILTAAAEHEASLIVIASYSESGFDRWVHGSVPGKVLRSAKCPLMLVRWDQAPPPA